MNKKEKQDFANVLLNKNNKYANYVYKESYFKKTYPEIYSELSLIDFPDDFKFGQKLWHYIYDDYDFDKRCNCKLHGKLKFLDFRRGYRKFCKTHCDEYDRINVIKRAETRIKNCGSVEESYRIGLEKQKQTCLERYGVENAGGVKVFLDNGAESIIERYGSVDEMYRQNKLKSDRTRIERYGSVEKSYEESVKKRKETLRYVDGDYYSIIHQKVKKTKLERYGDENYTNIDKRKQTCLERYGVDNFFKTSELIESNKKRSIKKTLEKYPEIIEHNTDSFLCSCIDSNCTLCKEKRFIIGYNSFFNRKFYKIDLCTTRTPETEHLPTSVEEKSLLSFIKTIYTGEIKENDRTILSGKELDIYLPEIKIAFEFNGVYWHSEFNKSKKYHQDKSLKCIENGVQLIHIWEDDWMNKCEIIKDIIKSKIGISDFNVGARKCTIKYVSNKDAYNFLNKYHIQGGVKSGKSIGLYYNDDLVEILTFGELRKNMGSNPTRGHYEIYRVCSKAGYNVQGGFSRLLRFFENEYNPENIITYGNLDYTNGNVYLKCGFEQENISEPTYTWVVNGIRRHRSNFMKSKLDECKCNPNLTESEVMYSRGSWKCWDSGKIRFRKKRE